MSYAATILATPGLANYWKLDEASGTTAADAFGGMPLTYGGGVTLGSTALTYGGVAAATFSRAGLGRASAGTSIGEFGVSVEAWFQASDLATARQCLLFNGSGTNGFGLFLNTDLLIDGHLHYLRQFLEWHDTGVAPSTTRPYHVVLTLDGSSNPRAYIDGLLAFTGSGAPEAPSGGFIIGAEDATGLNGFNGVIDDVSTYTVALDAATILAHYRAGTQPTIAPLASHLYRRRRAG